MSSLLLKFSLVLWLLVQAKSQKIVKMPSPLLIPANEIGMFSCEALCDGFQCTGFWIINDTQRIEVNEQRMMSHYSSSGNEYTLTLTVNASEAMNNTRIQCKYEVNGNMHGITRSDTIFLFVISSSPISSNPSISKNTTHLTLMWSPPFLWPGQRIQHYNISALSDRSTSYHRVDTSITNQIVTLSFPMSLNSLLFTTESLELNMSTCSEIMFSISPVTSDGSIFHLMETFNISDNWLSTFPPGSEFTTPAINVSVLFEADGTPALVEVYIQLPRISCSFSDLKYTLVVKNKQGNLMTEVDTFPNPDSGVIKENIKFDLKENQEYSTRLRVNVQSQTVTSQKHIFSTQLLNKTSCTTCNTSIVITSKNNSVLPYMMLTGIFGTLTLVFLVAFLVVTVSLCIQHRKRVTEIKLSGSRNRVCKVMVHNPIYEGDGPVYESVQTQYEGNETELNFSQSEDETDRQYDNLRLCVNNTARYIDPPVQLHYLYTSNIVSDDSDMVNAPINRSASLSTPLTTPRVMALKKNGQERNKLHLTLSLCGNDSSNSHTSEVVPKLIPKSCVVAPADTDEPYTVMSPAGDKIAH